MQMDADAVLGPVDPQLGQFPAASLLKLRAAKAPDALADETHILIDLAEKAMVQVRKFVGDLLTRRLPADRAHALAEMLTDGRWTHDYPLTPEQLQEYGLPIGHQVPAEVYRLMNLYRPQGDRRPSVLYTPAPGHPARTPRSGAEK